jgi:hypothetical protein
MGTTMLQVWPAQKLVVEDKGREEKEEQATEDKRGDKGLKHRSILLYRKSKSNYL